MGKESARRSKHKRRRLIGTGLSTSSRFTELGKRKNGTFFQLIYCLLMAHTDDYGIIEADPVSLKYLILPTSKQPESRFFEAVKAMHEVSLGTLYAWRGKVYFEVWDFEDGQLGWIRHDRIAGPRIPKYDPENNELEILPGLSRKFPEVPGDGRLALPYFTLPYSTKTCPNSEDFEKFWEAYGYKVGRKAAETAFDKVTEDLNILLSAIEEQRKPGGILDPAKGKYRPHASTWLNKERWKDEDVTGEQEEEWQYLDGRPYE